MAALFTLAAAPAGACLQGHRFDPPKPLKFDSPKIAPVQLDGLFPVRPPELAKPAIATGLERPAATPAAPVALTTAEQHAVFVDYVRAFEAQRAKTAGVSAEADTLDYAVALVHLGRPADAITTLLALEAARPGLYRTAANLGTAYELAGDLEEAVLWIARGIERNADSHHGTEWLHAAILHAKLKLRDDASWLRNHSVLDGMAERSAGEILRAIDYQLGERLHFVRPADAVVCDLFYQAALRVTGDGPEAAERRAHYWRESRRFGDWRKAEIAKRSKT